MAERRGTWQDVATSSRNPYAPAASPNTAAPTRAAAFPAPAPVAQPWPAEAANAGVTDDDDEEEEDEEEEGEEEETRPEVGGAWPPLLASVPAPDSPAEAAETEGASSSTAQAAAAEVSSVASEASTLRSHSGYSVDTSTPLTDQLDLRLWEAAFRHHTRRFPAPRSAPLASRTVALQVHLQQVEGLRLPDDDPTAAYAANLTLYHVGSHSFFGRTYTTETAGLVPAANGFAALRFDAHALWHTRLRDPDVKLVVEVFSLSANAAHAQHSRRSLGWALMDVDLPAFHDHAAAGSSHSLLAWCPLLASTPRLLLSASAPFPHKGAAQALLRVSTCPTPRWPPLVPADTLAGNSAPVPGLQLEAGAVSLDPVLRLTVAQIAVTLPAGYEPQLLAQMAASQAILHTTRVARKLRMMIHTSHVVVGRPQEVELTDVGHTTPGHPLMLGFQGSLQFDGFVHHRHCALLFELVYELVTHTAEGGMGTATVVQVVVGKYPFLPCRDEHIPSGGARMIQAFLLSGPLLSSAGRPVWVSRAPSPADPGLLPIVHSPFYLTFEAQGEPGRALPTPHPSFILTARTSSSIAGTPFRPPQSQSPRNLNRSSTLATAPVHRASTSEGMALRRRPTVVRASAASVPPAVSQPSTSGASTSAPASPQEAPLPVEVPTLPALDQPQKPVPAAPYDTPPSSVPPSSSWVPDTVGTSAEDLEGIGTPLPFQALAPSPAPAIVPMTPRRPSVTLLPPQPTPHTIATQPTPDPDTAPFPEPPATEAALPTAASPEGPPASAAAEAPTLPPAPLDPVGPYRGPAPAPHVGLQPLPAVNRLPEPPLFHHSIHTLQVDPPLAMTYADRALLRSVRFPAICDGTGHVVFGTQQANVGPGETMEKVGSSGSRSVLRSAPRLRLPDSAITIQVLGLVANRYPVVPPPPLLLFRCHFYNFGLQSAGPAAINKDLQDCLRPKTDAGEYPTSTLIPPTPDDPQAPLLHIVWPPEASEDRPTAGCSLQLRHCANDERDRRAFIQYLQTSRLYIDVYDANSLFLYGRAALELRPISRHADQKFCVHTEECSVLACDEHHFQRDDAMTTGFQPQCTVNQATSELGLRQIRSKLIIRVANVGVEGKQLAAPAEMAKTVPARLPKYAPKLEELCRELKGGPAPAAVHPAPEAADGTASKKEARLLAFKRKLALAQAGDRGEGSASDAKYWPAHGGFDFLERAAQSVPVRWTQWASQPQASCPPEAGDKWAAISDKVTTIDLFRATQKQHTLKQHLRQAIAEELTLPVTLGYPTFFEVSFANPYREDHCFSFHIAKHPSGVAAQDLQAVTDLEQWRHLCVAEGQPGPVGEPPTAAAICGRGGATVRLPLRFRRFAPASAEAGTDQYAVTVRTAANVEVRHVIITFQCRPEVVHQAFQLYCRPDAPFVRWLFVDTLPEGRVNPRPAQDLGLHLGGPEFSTLGTKWIVCGDRHAKLTSFVHRIECGGQRAENQEHVEVRLPSSRFDATPYVCFLVLYNDVFMDQVWEVWRLDITVCPGKLVEAQVGCSNRIQLSLRSLLEAAPQAEEPLQLACAASHPELSLVAVTDGGDLQAAYHPRLPMHSVFYINAVDQRRHTALGTFLVEIRANYPQPTRIWSESIPPLGRASLVRRIPFYNLYYGQKSFVAFTTTPQHLRIHPAAFTLNPGQAEPLVLTFSGINLVGRWQFYVFINTVEEDQTEECLEVSLTVIDLKAALR